MSRWQFTFAYYWSQLDTHRMSDMIENERKTEIRHDWTREEISDIYHQPLLELVFAASQVHKVYHKIGEVQVSSLVSVKTGGCPEDCAYCPQAARYHTDIKVHKLMEVDEVVKKAINAQAQGVSRMCLGAAWREVRDNADFDKVCEMVSAINEMGMEVCCTLGMVTEDQAKKLAAAGLYAYNHNVDTSEEHYGDIITTRTYDDRLNTIQNVRKAKLTVCSGGIIGMGETHDDRIGMLHTLSNLEQHPESVPVNALVAVKGTPLGDQKKIPFDDLVRMIATARIIMPASVVRLSAGRMDLSISSQAMCFMAGANSIFAGDKLLTTPNPDYHSDEEMFSVLGLTPRAAFQDEQSMAKRN